MRYVGAADATTYAAGSATTDPGQQDLCTSHRGQPTAPAAEHGEGAATGPEIIGYLLPPAPVRTGRRHPGPVGRERGLGEPMHLLGTPPAARDVTHGGPTIDHGPQAVPRIGRRGPHPGRSD